MNDFHGSQLWQKLHNAKHGVIIMIGTGQWGKTVTVHSLIASGVFKDRNIALINYPKDFTEKHYPAKYRAVRWPDELDDVPKYIRPSRDVVVVDDAIFLVGSRDHATRENKDLQKLMTISSHHELFFIVTIQSSALLDRSMMQSQDVYMIHKMMDGVSLEFERPEIKMRQVIANSMLGRYMKEYPDIHPKSWAYCSSTHEMFSFDLPPYWSPLMSKPFYGVIPQ